MQQITKSFYKCDICGAEYSSKEEAKKCESRPVSKDKGVKIGDTVRILSGDGTGKLAIVTSRSIVDKNWGHYMWDVYWHTVMLGADIKDEYGSRALTFDAYEPA